MSGNSFRSYCLKLVNCLFFFCCHDIFFWFCDLSDFDLEGVDGSGFDLFLICNFFSSQESVKSLVYLDGILCFSVNKNMYSIFFDWKNLIFFNN